MKMLFALVFAAAGCMASAHAQAPASEAYPTGPVKIINPWQYGGGVDALARLLANKLHERWRQPVIVDSKPGAGGNIGSEFVAKSAPDGHTLLINNSTLTTNPPFFKKMPFDAAHDLAPVGLIAMQQFYLVVTNSLPVRNMGELIAYAKANPGKLFYATPGIGTPQHLAGELLRSTAGVDITHSPYKGQAPAMADVIAGQAHMTWVTLNAALPLIQAGKVRGIAISSLERSRAYPDVPVVSEVVPGYEIYTWVGLFAPAGTPQNVITQLNGEVQRFARMPDVMENLVTLGYDIKVSTPAELRTLMRDESAKWARLAKTVGIKPQ